MKYHRVIVVFRRDLRLDDNTALLKAASESKEVIPIFIFDPRQIRPHPYFSENALLFMLESLQELNGELRSKGSKLHCFYGEAAQVLAEVASKVGAEAAYFNRDYTPFSKSRDSAIERDLAALGIRTYITGDALLHEPEEVLKSDNSPYTVYTPFSKRALKVPVRKPKTLSSASSLVKSDFGEDLEKIIERQDIGKLSNSGDRAGRKKAISLLERLPELVNYSKERDLPALASTSRLSPHNKFGTISVREVYWQIAESLGSEHLLINELLWRDFFTHIAFHFPQVFERNFNPRYGSITWENDKKKFAAWCEGRTGYPIVDAGMRELNSTGIMHNRVRMITASFLVKDLLIDWRWGERYFAQKLLDYDPAVNNGNWQWAASTGCDAQPYFRVFNPWLQQRKFDTSCEYIKKWVPELAEHEPKEIHAGQRQGMVRDYHHPIVDHVERRSMAVKLFEQAAEESKK
ncbi:MAG: deoxyribodipyrimidine photolyase [Proteobacteria bacterium]|nr:MAG: deoxyribodipyrimidine photolyase [Pseudomonadota bacterium]